MASNHFFSGRIPNELYEQAEKHCEETGDSKTEVLIKALSTYLNFPITIPGKNIIVPSPEVTKEMFEALEERIKILENALKGLPVDVINNDNKSGDTEEIEKTNNDNVLEIFDNKTDNLKVENISQDVIGDDNRGDNQAETNNDNALENINNEVDNLETESTKQDVINNDNNKKEIITDIEKVYPSFRSIFTNEVAKKTNMSDRQSYRLAGKAKEKLKQEGKDIEPKQLLETPIEVTQRGGITVNDYPYKLFYLGENLKEKSIWDLIPDNNSSYQEIIRDLVPPKNKVDNEGYQDDNNVIS